MIDKIPVTLSPADAAAVVKDAVMATGMSVECVGEYVNVGADGREVVLLVFEKYFMRNESRASLSVVFENLGQATWVGYAGSGGGGGTLFRFDWGAGEDFASAVPRALADYVAR